MSKQKAKQKTIKFDELKRLSFCNSKHLPEAIEINGVRKEWVGIGWIDCDELKGDEVLVID